MPCPGIRKALACQCLPQRPPRHQRTYSRRICLSAQAAAAAAAAHPRAMQTPLAAQRSRTDLDADQQATLKGPSPQLAACQERGVVVGPPQGQNGGQRVRRGAGDW